MNPMDAIVQRVIENNFSELAGLTVNASIPVTETLINEMIEAALRGNKNITHCSVSVGAENRVNAHVKTRLWPWPLDLKLKLFRAVDVMSSLKVRAFLENNVLLSRLGSLFKALPAGITVYQDQVAVDLGMFLRPDQKKILELIQAAEIHTEPGRLILDVRLER